MGESEVNKQSFKIKVEIEVKADSMVQACELVEDALSVFWDYQIESVMEDL